MKRMEVTEKEIGKNTFYIRPFAAFTAANISGEVVSVLSPVLGGLAPLFGNMEKESGKKGSAGSETESVMDMDIEKALPAITDALGNVSGDKIEHLMKRLLIDNGNISVEGPDTDGDVKKLDRDLADEIFCGEI